MDNARSFKGIWICKQIWESDELSALEKVILAEIDSLDNDNHCTASNEYFANFCKCSVPTVTRCISNLINLGFIEVVSFNGRVRVLKSNISCLIKMISLPNQNDEAGSSKRLGDIININNNKNINKESIDIDSCAQPEVEHEKSIKILDSAEEIKQFRNPRSTIKRTLISDTKTNHDLEELKTKTTAPKNKTKSDTKDKVDFKRNSFINKAIEIIVTQLRVSDENIICLIKDWLDVCYDKGVTTEKARFKHIVEDLSKVIQKYNNQKVSDILHASIVGGYITLSYAIQNLEKMQYNRPHTKAEDYKFPGIKKEETVDEYLARTHESPEEHQKRMEELKQKKKRGELKSY